MPRAALHTLHIHTAMAHVLFMVKAIELPNELSTWVCAAKCITVSIFSCSSTCTTRSEDWMSPLMNLRGVGGW